KTEFADKIGVNPHTIILWEQSVTVPTEENRKAIVRVLDFPNAFFDGPDIDEPNKEATSFRSQTSMTAAMRDAAFAAGAIGYLIFDWVESRFELPQGNLPDLHLDDSA